MKKLGTFFDDITGANYDLYHINALTMKKAIDKSYKLTELKLRMFDGATQVASDIKYEIEVGILKFDWKKGKVLNLKEFKADSQSNSMHKMSILNTNEHKKLGYSDGRTKSAEVYHQLGYELLPIAISLKDKNVNDMSKVELLDGFKRFFIANVPDKDIFVKVYDILDSVQWFNAMLLFNGWKLLGRKDAFLDRGFKLGLYKHFGLDLTLSEYSHRFSNSAVDYINFYMVNPYKVFKNNPLAINDIKLLLEGFQYFKGKEVIFFQELAIMLGTVRYMETNNRSIAKQFTMSELIEFFQTKAMKKHFTKINKMKVDGFIKNYIEKYMMEDVAQYIRNKYGFEKKITEHKYTIRYGECFKELQRT